MLKIRLQRVGRTHEPAFRLVLTESENSTKSGRFKEVLGSYDPRKTGEVIKAERVSYWLSKGAIPTGSVQNLLIKKGIVRGKKTHVGADYKTPAAPVAEAAEAPAEASAPEAPAPEAAPAE